MQKYDTDGNAVLEAAELATAPETLHRADRDRDGQVAVEELAQYLAIYARTKSLVRNPKAEPDVAELPPLFHPSTPAGTARRRAWRDTDQDASDGESLPTRAVTPTSPLGPRRFYVPLSQLPQGLPEWFLPRDADGDAQLSLSEFAPTGAPASAAEFNRYDLNRDGLLTPQEVVRFGPKPTREPMATGAQTAGTPAARVPKAAQQATLAGQAAPAKPAKVPRVRKAVQPTTLTGEAAAATPARATRVPGSVQPSAPAGEPSAVQPARTRRPKPAKPPTLIGEPTATPAKTPRAPRGPRPQP